MWESASQQSRKVPLVRVGKHQFSANGKAPPGGKLEQSGKAPYYKSGKCLPAVANFVIWVERDPPNHTKLLVCHPVSSTRSRESCCQSRMMCASTVRGTWRISTRLEILFYPVELKGRLLKAVARTLSCGVASKTKTENKYKDTSDSSEAQHSEAPSPSGHFASDLARVRHF